MARTSDSNPEGIAASITVTLNSRLTKPKRDTMQNAISGKIINFMTDVNITTCLDLDIPSNSIERPKEIIIRGIAASEK